MVSVPAVVIAAPASGSGKTTVATGLIGALRRAGHRVAPFKVGPDYIDPGYHGLAAGAPGRNLDPILVGRNRIGPLFRHGSTGSDISVVEGVMGLFDGKIDAGSAGDAIAEGSTAAVAALLGAPVVLVIDARGHSQSLAAVLHGFATFDSGVRIGGVILNNVASDRHEHVLRDAAERVGIPVLGVVPRMPELEVPSRHLGLIPAVEHGRNAVDAVDAMTTLIGKHVQLDAVVSLARSDVGPQRWNASEVGDAVDASPVVAIAGGAAFTFGYAEHRELLAAAGARVITVDPLHDVLPDDVAALVLPGGFPEAHAADLSANHVLLQQVYDLAGRGMPIYAECAGLLYLARSLDGVPMAGVLDAEAVFGARLPLGYREAVALTDSSLWRAGERVAGHEFHRTRLTAAPPDGAWAWRTWEGVGTRDGFVQNNVHASYLHTHPAGNPHAVGRFVRTAAAHAADRARVAHG